ncbi:aminotransferase class I/II-fold pyridoxal phosphate-dependent enzyme [uncultured Prevotella sp.]|uniref:aminotransferase class I/II-fold pyridoxal phosphate-dependent enzyme n=1 Tax=uncultured Prevotella sp. TaxID=159272 RepID=UPI0025D833E8|nr:aminotransferase class I/II-fold pyridoxal phosphate-dependent enzyme [uncultured Prevotella sp.]
MQAIILAAGMGRRLGELTKNNTKCMLEVNGVRLIDRYLRQLSKYSLDRIVIVVGYEGQKLIDYIHANYSDINIEFVNNPIYDKTNNIYSLALAKDYLCADDTILMESDLIVEDGIIDKLLNHTDKDLALVAKYEQWMDGTMVRIDDNRRILQFIPKAGFRYEEADDYYKTVNIYKFSREFSSKQYIPFLEAYCKVMGNNEYYEQVLSVLTLLQNTTLRALPIGNEKWYEIDDVQDLDIASTLFSEDKNRFQLYHKRYGGFWRFPKLLDFCYLVNPFFPNKRMRDEIRNNFDTLLESYPSGMGVNSLLAGKYFGIKQDYVVVGNGAAELIKVVMEEHTNGRVGVIFPTFDEYPNRLKQEQIVQFIPTDSNFGYTADELMEYYNDKQLSLLMLVNPDNPSGHFMPKADVLRLAAWCDKKDIKLLVDESFVDFTEEYEKNSLLHNDILASNRNLMVMKSISKSYGVPGIRLGVFASSDTELIQRIKKEVSIWNINSFGEFYMQIYGKYENDYRKACRKFCEVREKFYEDLKQIDFLRVIPSQANYFLCEVTRKYTSAELCELLIEKDIIISNCGKKKHMDGRNLVRLAVRDEADNARLVEVLKSLA